MGPEQVTNGNDSAKKRPESGQDPSLQTVLVPLVIVVLFITGMVALKHFLSPARHIQEVLASETHALETGDLEAFTSLQDVADPNWCRHQKTIFDSRVFARERGEPWALEPEPMPRIVDVERQGERAWVEVETEQEGTTRRQVAFFRLVYGEWKHTGPDERYWGEPQETYTEHLRWIYRARDEEWVTSLFDSTEQAYRQICADFGLDPAQQQVTIEVVYSLDRAYLSLYPEEPVLAMPSPLLVGLDDDLVAGLPATLLLDYLGLQASGGDPSNLAQPHRTVLDAIKRWEATQLSLISWWPSYGVPQLAEAIEAGKLLPLSEVWGEGEAQRDALADVQSYSAIEYLVARRGAKSIPPLLQALGTQLTVEDALQTALGPGFVFEEFEAGWRKWIWQEYGPP